MRRFLFGVVIASVTAAMPVWAFGGDREIAKTVMAELQQHKAAGNLKGFDIDLKVEDGIVYLDGNVVSNAQRALVAQAAVNAVGAENLVNHIQVKGEQVKGEQAKVELERTTVAKTTPVARAMPVAISKASTETAPKQTQPVKPAASQEQSVAPSYSDVAVTNSVIGMLQNAKQTGELRGFELDVSTVNGDLWLRGTVADYAQKDLVLDIARHTRGVARVIDDISVASEGAVRQVSTGGLALVPQESSMPVASQPVPAGLASRPVPAGLASMPVPMGGGYAGTPVPMQAVGASYGAGAPRYDQPNMPSYAWPSYAAHPNYAAVTYPKQYSPSAWPYIGPFYPYPQVPLGWRKVALEWDDGLWYLDFTSK